MLSLVPPPAPAPPRDVPLSWRLARFAPRFFPGATLHRAALWTAATGSRERAQHLFEAAASRYRRELRVEPLARLRVHQRMLAVGAEADCAIEVERGLLALDRIESPCPPFALVSARSLVGTWPRLVGSAVGSSVSGERSSRSRRLAA